MFWRPVRMPNTRLQCDLLSGVRNLYGETFLADFSLISNDGRLFPVHRFVLTSSSEVFAAMFDVNCEESQTGSCNIDVDGDSLDWMLRFLHGQCTCITEFATSGMDTRKLLVVAERFSIDSLVDLCMDVLSRERIEMENVVELLVLADKHSVMDLKERSLEFIWCNIQEFLKFGHLESIRKHSVDLVEKVVKSVKACACMDDAVPPLKRKSSDMGIVALSPLKRKCSHLRGKHSTESSWEEDSSPEDDPNPGNDWTSEDGSGSEDDLKDRGTEEEWSSEEDSDQDNCKEQS